jgi:hypothetical protein
MTDLWTPLLGLVGVTVGVGITGEFQRRRDLRRRRDDKRRQQQQATSDLHFGIMRFTQAARDILLMVKAGLRKTPIEIRRELDRSYVAASHGLASAITAMQIVMADPLGHRLDQLDAAYMDATEKMNGAVAYLGNRGVPTAVGQANEALDKMQACARPLLTDLVEQLRRSFDAS